MEVYILEQIGVRGKSGVRDLVCSPTAAWGKGLRHEVKGTIESSPRVCAKSQILSAV